MCAKLVFVRRSEEKIKIFGGNVYVDLDGKNIGIIDNDNLTIDIEAGKHKIKMYKSHNYGSMVGFAEVELDIKDDEKLAFKYTCPMTITQPGHIIVSDFISYDKIESELQNEDIILKNEKKKMILRKKKLIEYLIKTIRGLFF